MQIRSILPLLGLVAACATSPLPTSDIPSDENTPKCPNYCAGTAYNASLVATYVCGDSRLGPRLLPKGIVLGDLVDDYHRFGGLCPGEFLAKWYDSSAGSWIYPPQAGFQLTSGGTTIEGAVTLPVDFLLDRFGSEYGTYTSPQGAPYKQRALPPSNLDTPQSTPVYVDLFSHGVLYRMLI
jgi:hypothetical protein